MDVSQSMASENGMEMDEIDSNKLSYPSYSISS